MQKKTHNSIKSVMGFFFNNSHLQYIKWNQTFTTQNGYPMRLFRNNYTYNLFREIVDPLVPSGKENSTPVDLVRYTSIDESFEETWQETQLFVQYYLS